MVADYYPLLSTGGFRDSEGGLSQGIFLNLFLGRTYQDHLKIAPRKHIESKGVISLASDSLLLSSPPARAFSKKMWLSEACPLLRGFAKVRA